MGAPKQKWTSEEEEALKAGVNKHGTGKWKNIQKDPEFGHCLAARSNIDFKDKWRNMSVSSTGEGSRTKGVKAAAAATTPKVPKTPAAIFQSPSSSQSTEDLKDKVLDPTKNTADGKLPPRYNAMILEALSNIKEPNEADIGVINDFIVQRHEVRSNFRRLLSSKLRKFVAQDKLEKVNPFHIILITTKNCILVTIMGNASRYLSCVAETRNNIFVSLPSTFQFDFLLLPLSLQYGFSLVEKYGPPIFKLFCDGFSICWGTSSNSNAIGF
ncbi:hypothetical protein MKX01_037008 [Papaver californicum]|nr:hypothetical protein MKX01_037008 [Papaver californicum]